LHAEIFSLIFPALYTCFLYETYWNFSLPYHARLAWCKNKLNRITSCTRVRRSRRCPTPVPKNQNLKKVRSGGLWNTEAGNIPFISDRCCKPNCR